MGKFFVKEDDFEDFGMKSIIKAEDEVVIEEEEIIDDDDDGMNSNV